MLFTPVLQCFHLCMSIARKFIDCYDIRQSELLYCINVLCKIFTPCQHRFHIFILQILICYIAVLLQGTNGCYNYHCIWLQPTEATLDIQELFSSKISTKACLCHRIIRKLQTCSCRKNGITAMSDIGKRTAVNQYRIMFQCLYHIRFDGILHNHCQSPFNAKVLYINRLLL